MPTPAYLIAQQVIPKVKAQCPLIVRVAPGKNSFTFFAGSPYEQTVQFRKMMARANPFWEPSTHEPAVLDWRMRVNATWLSSIYEKILLDEICPVIGIPESTKRYNMAGDLPEITGRAMQIAKARIWGIPQSLRAEGWFSIGSSPPAAPKRPCQKRSGSSLAPTRGIFTASTSAS